MCGKSSGRDFARASTGCCSSKVTRPTDRVAIRIAQINTTVNTRRECRPNTSPRRRPRGARAYRVADATEAATGSPRSRRGKTNRCAQYRHIAIRDDDMGGNQCNEQARRNDMSRLKSPAVPPQPTSHGRRRRHDERRQQEERRHARELIERCGGFEVLNDIPVFGDEPDHVQRGSNEDIAQPASAWCRNESVGETASRDRTGMPHNARHPSTPTHPESWAISDLCWSRRRWPARATAARGRNPIAHNGGQGQSFSWITIASITRLHPRRINRVRPQRRISVELSSMPSTSYGHLAASALPAAGQTRPLTSALEPATPSLPGHRLQRIG